MNEELIILIATDIANLKVRMEKMERFFELLHKLHLENVERETREETNYDPEC